MTTMTEQDEAQLRERLHTIGDAISTCHDEGRADLLAPRPSHRYGVTVAVAAAVLVLVGVAVLVTRGGDEAATTRVADGSGVLDGLKLAQPPATAFLSTDRGLVIVTDSDDAHGRWPSVYAPGPDGVYRWYVDTEVEGLMPGPAWVDGDTIRAAGFRCPPDEQQPTTVRFAHCDLPLVVALSFSLETMEWSDAVLAESGGLPLSSGAAAGNGRYLIVSTSDEAGVEPGSLARVDVIDGSVTRLHGSVGAPQICASGNSFVIGTITAAAVAAGSGSSPSPKPGDGPPHVGLVVGDRIVTVPVDAKTWAGSRGVATANGCAAGGMLVTRSGDHGLTNSPVIVIADPDGESVSQLGSPTLPTGWTARDDVSFGADATASALVAQTGSRQPGGAESVAVWDGIGDTWHEVDEPVPSRLWIVASRPGQVFGFDVPQDPPNASGHLRGPFGR